MILYLIRHAIAEDQAKWKGLDQDRPLTAKGRKSAHQVAKGLRHLSVKVDRILSSPYRRAYDTACISAKELHHHKKILRLPDLAPGGDPAHMMKTLVRSYPPSAKIALVGHEPYLSHLVAHLIGARAPLSIDFKKGGVCRIDRESKTVFTGQLKWMLTPKLIRKLT